MKISKRIEPFVRSAIHAAVRRDFGRLDEALKAFPDDASVQEGIQLTLAVILYVLRDIHHGGPSDEEVRAVAAEIARAEAWAKPSAEEVESFLVTLAHGEHFADGTSSEGVIILSFVSVANLLAACRRDGEDWWDYLDRVEAALEAA